MYMYLSIHVHIYVHILSVTPRINMGVYTLYTQHNIYMYNTCIYTCDFAKAAAPIKYTN